MRSRFLADLSDKQFAAKFLTEFCLYYSQGPLPVSISVVDRPCSKVEK